MTRNLDNNQKTWEDLARAAQAGDKAAYQTLLREIIPFARSVLVGRLANPSWVDDVVQEVLLSTHKALHTYDPQKPFKPWLISIINFRRSDFLRAYYRKSHKKETTLESLDAQTIYVTNDGIEGEWKDVENALDDLPKKQKRIFKMMKIEGYTAKEVAERLDMNESAVKVSAHRTMNKLKQLLGAS